MYHVQLTGSKTFYSHILMYSSTQNNGVGIAKEFQKNMLEEHCKYRVIDQGKYIKISSKIKYIDR